MKTTGIASKNSAECEAAHTQLLTFIQANAPKLQPSLLPRGSTVRPAPGLVSCQTWPLFAGSSPSPGVCWLACRDVSAGDWLGLTVGWSGGGVRLLVVLGDRQPVKVLQGLSHLLWTNVINRMSWSLEETTRGHDLIFSILFYDCPKVLQLYLIRSGCNYSFSII